MWLESTMDTLAFLGEAVVWLSFGLLAAAGIAYMRYKDKETTQQIEALENLLEQEFVERWAGLEERMGGLEVQRADAITLLNIEERYGIEFRMDAVPDGYVCKRVRPATEREETYQHINEAIKVLQERYQRGEFTYQPPEEPGEHQRV